MKHAQTPLREMIAQQMQLLRLKSGQFFYMQESSDETKGNSK